MNNSAGISGACLDPGIGIPGGIRIKVPKAAWFGQQYW